jgi:hypothetical protein
MEETGSNLYAIKLNAILLYPIRMCIHIVVGTTMRDSHEYRVYDQYLNQRLSIQPNM